jgi:hypothetical protein
MGAYLRVLPDFSALHSFRVTLFPSGLTRSPLCLLLPAHLGSYIDRPLNEDDTDKIRKYRADYNNNPPNAISFIPAIASTSGRLHCEFVILLFLQVRFLINNKFIGKLTDFLKFQEFSFRNITVSSSTVVSKPSHHISNRKWTTSSLNLLYYGSL